MKVSTGMACEIPLACLFQVLGWLVLFVLVFRNGVWQKWCETGQAVSVPAYILDSHSSEKSEIHKCSVNILPLLSEELSKRHNG